MDELHDCYYSETAFQNFGSAVYQTDIGLVHVTEIVTCGKKPLSKWADLVQLPHTVRYEDFRYRVSGRNSIFLLPVFRF